MLRKFTTLYRHIIDEERKYPDATGELSDLLADIALACKVISLEVNRAGLIDLMGITGSENVHGEQVKKLDEYAHDTLVKAMEVSGHSDVLHRCHHHPPPSPQCSTDPRRGSQAAD